MKLKYIFFVIYVLLALGVWKWESGCDGFFIFDFCNLGYTLLIFPELGIVSLFSKVQYEIDLRNYFLNPTFIIISVILNSIYLYYFGLLLSKKFYKKAFISLLAIIIIPIIIWAVKF
ncbi:MAG: hypothetical protein A2720_02090 [Candidatus Doudnabacteria bacterium RIFCSPHIGHO2_01_FULL_46_24]|uniref:Uncharacterized protein n=1 Tax=Candidatus Doudnabacteria bacterium RIFCSPHIGHO2_01_FULL_46_24 TaxID=1817825 RepID=A0A1F5NVJ2_9BACT|nr:MAG: hypothetical protein A2720_02090 [Candidatus Doudnabacteria bacterium RIFCSPHIGHO2_01_FULL_46_24]